MEVTQWFDAMHDPVHPGLYEVAFFNRGREIARHFAEWTGSHWKYVNSMRPSAGCGDKWRGMAQPSSRK